MRWLRWLPDVKASWESPSIRVSLFLENQDEWRFSIGDDIWYRWHDMSILLTCGFSSRNYREEVYAIDMPLLSHWCGNGARLKEEHVCKKVTRDVGWTKIKFLLTFSALSRLLTIYSQNYRQSTIFEQVLKIFGECQNCQNWTFKRPYQLYKAISEKYFFVKMFTMMLLHMKQIFSSLRGHLHFSLHFFFTYLENFFFNHPI